MNTRYKIRLTNLVNGYIRNLNINQQIPIELKQIVVSYSLIVLEFYEKQHGNNLEFSNGNIVKLKCKVADWSACAFGNHPISLEICNKFKIEFKWIHQTMSFFMGFIVTKDFNNLEFNWNDYIGGGKDNIRKSWGVLIHSYNKSFSLFDASYTGKILDYQAPKQFSENDTFGLLFDFVDSTITIYHNSEKADSLALPSEHYNCKCIIPAIAIYREMEEIEVIDYEFS
eukprot:122672_1